MADDDEGTGLGAKFWLGLIGATLALAIGGLILFLIVGAVWYAWGFLGTLLVLFAVTAGFGYVHDRRAQRRYERLPT